MKSPESNSNGWLDDALAEVIGSEESKANFEKWKQAHPEAVEMLTSRAQRTPSASGSPLKIRSMIVNSKIAKLAVAAAIIVVALIGTHRLTNKGDSTADIGPALVAGPKTIELVDGSVVKLAQGAEIQLYGSKDERGFEHTAGQIDVSVAKGQSEFVVTTPYGNIKALGTEFTLDVIDGIAANTQERVQLLAVKVKEGQVEVSNAVGSRILKEYQRLTVQKDEAPYDFTQDDNLPARLRDRIAGMIDALEASDTKAWMANYNINYMYKLVKGEVEYDPKRFGGSKTDAERIQETFGDVKSPEELLQRCLAGGGIKGSANIYVRSVEMNDDGDHAVATCVSRHDENRMTLHTPQWHYWDDDWWQTDD